MPPATSVYMRKLKAQLQGFLRAKEDPKETSQGRRSRDSDVSMRSLPRALEPTTAGASGSLGSRTEVFLIYGPACFDGDTVFRGQCLGAL